VPQRFKKFGYRPGWKPRPKKSGSEGLYYDRNFLDAEHKKELIRYLESLHPIWENRFSDLRPPPQGQQQRRLLRPVYWLGNWQFACLDYYRPPKGLFDRCVEAEPFPPVLRALVDQIETIARGMFHGDDMPKRWELNTCLVNYYGRRREGDTWVDTARVGEHKDFEPGPVASISVGERALFQFVRSTRPGERDAVEAMQWLDDGSLQIFGGDRWKKHLFHRVQRVDHKAGVSFAVPAEGFEVRRINLTFRYVPREHVVPVKGLSAQARADVDGYLRTLAQRSPHFARALAEAGS
jgi:DNA oxidative demethylase